MYTRPVKVNGEPKWQTTIKSPGLPEINYTGDTSGESSEGALRQLEEMRSVMVEVWGEAPPCPIRREADMMVCHACGRAWSVDEPGEVLCDPVTQNQAVGRQTFANIERMLDR